MEDMHPRTSLAAELGVEELLKQGRYLAALDQIIPILYGEVTPSPRRQEAAALRDRALAALQAYMTTATHPPRTRMKFGTSGWRGLLGEDFTLRNVMRVTQGLCEVLLGPEGAALAGPLQIKDAAEMRERGCVLAHDTRFMGPQMCAAISRVLLAHGVRVIFIGTATTPEVSAALFETGAAFSLNLTPSHNPYSYHGYKFNPADGGPATGELTGPITRRANEIFDGDLPVQAISEDELALLPKDPNKEARYREADPIALYRQSLQKRLPFLDLPRLIEGINQLGMDLYIDNGYGATTGKYEALLQGIDPARLHVLHKAPEFLFGGKNREPSAENFSELQRLMAGSPARLMVGVMNDGDGDRFIGGGRQAVLGMNRFGPLVVRYLTEEHGVRGDVTRSLMTSHMADAAQRRYQPDGKLNETRVGFQFLKPHIPTSVNSFEESDGMSPKGWSRDKDGICAALLLAAMVLETGKTAEELSDLLETELGSFVFERRKIVGALSGEALAKAITAHFGGFVPGQSVAVPGIVREMCVDRVDTRDGIKVVFGHGWWFGVRASGTEPAARIYVETYAPPGASVKLRALAEEGKDHLHAWAKEELMKAMG